MYRNQEKDLTTSLLTAALGAGVITSFAVAQGQNLWTAISITLFAAAIAVIIDLFL